MTTPPTPPANVTVHTERGTRVMTFPAGRLDGNTLRQMYELTIQEIHAPNARLLVDLTGVVVVSSSGMSMFITLRKKCLGIGAQMHLAVPNPQVWNTFTLMRLDQVLPLFQSREDAFLKFKPPAKPLG